MDLRKIPLLFYLTVIPVNAETYRHYGRYGDIHCETTTYSYRSGSSSHTSCTTPEERRRKEKRRQKWEATLKRNTERLGADCETYGKLKGRYLAEKNNWIFPEALNGRKTPPWITVQTQECIFEITRGKLPDDYKKFMDQKEIQNPMTP